jgi:DNA-binding MurR/RpiR family transcriptional regulator
MAQRIARKLPSLTRSHLRMAEYVLARPLQAATLPIDELAASLGLSVATANRFARALEFDGYPQFRAALVLGFESTLAPVEKLRNQLEQPASAVDVFASALTQSQHNIERTRQALDAQSCQQAVKAILGARRVYILGFGASSWLGGLLQRCLEHYCDDVHLLASIESSSYAGRSLTRLKPSDLLIAIAFPRYFNDTIELARQARDRGIPVLALTDSVTSPLAPLAMVALYAHTENRYFANSEASALALLEALSCAVAHASKESLNAAAQLADAVLPWLHESSRQQRPPAAPKTARQSASAPKTRKPAL